MACREPQVFREEEMGPSPQERNVLLQQTPPPPPPPGLEQIRSLRRSGRTKLFFKMAEPGFPGLTVLPSFEEETWENGEEEEDRGSQRRRDPKDILLLGLFHRLE